MSEEVSAVTLDLDGDGRPDRARIVRDAAPVPGALPLADEDADRVVVTLGDGRTVAVAFPFVETLTALGAGVRPPVNGSDCWSPADGPALLAASEEGAMVIRVAHGRVTATPCFL